MSILRNQDLIGKKFNLLTVLERSHTDSYRQCVWKCVCDCGNTTYVTSSKLNSSHTKSCGCLGKHGKHGSPVYNSWCYIKQRCLDENSSNYERYGGKGVTMQSDWARDFKLFYEYIGDPPEDGNRYTIDRIDNDKGYEEGNIRWATYHQQARNQRIRSNNKTGVTGVTFEKEDSEIFRYKAHWTDLEGKLRCKSFSVKKYGEELAFFLACEMRELAIERLNAAGAGYTENHGK